MVGKAIIIILLLFSTKFLWTIIFPETEEMPDLAILWLLLYAVTYFWVFKKKSFYRYVVYKDNLWIIIFVLFFLIISPFTELPGLSGRRSLALLLTVLLGFYITFRYNETEIISLIRIYFLIIISSFSIIYFMNKEILIMPEIFHAGSYRGVFTHKNIFGRISALGVLFFLAQFNENKKLIELFSASILVYFVFISKSSGSILFLLIGLSIYLIYLIQSKYLKIISLTLLLFGFIGLIYYSFSFQDFYGESKSLLDRYLLWQRGILFWLEKPVLGYGYSVFWEVYGFESGGNDLMSLNWDAPHSHNGYIEILLAGGVIGLALFLIILVKFFSISNLGRDFFWICCMIFIIVTGLFENIPLIHNDFQLILFIVSFSVVNQKINYR